MGIFEDNKNEWDDKGDAIGDAKSIFGMIAAIIGGLFTILGTIFAAIFSIFNLFGGNKKNSGNNDKK